VGSTATFPGCTGTTDPTADTHSQYCFDPADTPMNPAVEPATRPVAATPIAQRSPTVPTDERTPAPSAVPVATPIPVRSMSPAPFDGKVTGPHGTAH
jgi:hypothetical protein